MVDLTKALAVFIVGFGLLCGCGGRNQMSSHAIVQNETFTVTGDSVIEDTVFAVAVKPDRIETNITMARLDSLYSYELEGNFGLIEPL